MKMSEITFTGRIRTDQAIRVPKVVKDSGFKTGMVVMVTLRTIEKSKNSYGGS